jgi:hypothetical protein
MPSNVLNAFYLLSNLTFLKLYKDGITLLPFAFTDEGTETHKLGTCS